MKRASDRNVERFLEQADDVASLTKHYGLSKFWEQLVFHEAYIASDELNAVIIPNELGEEIVRRCHEATAVPMQDALLAIYGHFYHHELLINWKKSNIFAIQEILSNEIRSNQVRIPYIWGRLLHDRFNSEPNLTENNIIPHTLGWEILNDSPTGIFQHGLFISGPLGIIEGTEHRWIPFTPMLIYYYRQGTRTISRSVPFHPAKIAVVTAYRWINEYLESTVSPSIAWGEALAWHGSRQSIEKRTDYTDILALLAECILEDDRASLMDWVLKTDDGQTIRKILGQISLTKGMKKLPPHEIVKKLDEFQQLQLLLSVETRTLVEGLDDLILSHQIEIPPSEIRHSHWRFHAPNIAFPSELSSIGLRAAHPEPFTALCSAILRAYKDSDTENELEWRLGSDPSRGTQETLTEFVRREGPASAVSKLILASQPVTKLICDDLSLEIADVNPHSEQTVPRILWKFGFEIARHDEVLTRLRRRLQEFEEVLSDIDLSKGEASREKIRSFGVNLFVSVEEFLDSIIAYNVWLLSSDHWGGTRFEYRVSEARRSVAEILGTTIESVEGITSWKTSGENALGTQLTYLWAFEQWIANLSDAQKVKRHEIVDQADDFNRPFPFNHTQLWADSSSVELERYKVQIKRLVKAISLADAAGVRNGLDHQRDASRFPSEAVIRLCVSHLKDALRMAEHDRIFPVTYWFDSSVKRVFGASERTFKNARNQIFTIYRPSTVSSLPRTTKIQPTIIAPVNFLGAGDSLLTFNLMGESDYSRYWLNFPIISKILKVDTGPTSIIDSDTSVVEAESNSSEQPDPECDTA